MALRMILSENRCPLFGIMRPGKSRAGLSTASAARTIAAQPCPINGSRTAIFADMEGRAGVCRPGFHACGSCTRMRPMTYRAPVADIAFTLKHAAGLKAALAEGLYGDLDEETVDSVLVEAGRFATDVIAPLNRIGDKHGTPFKDGAVTTPPGWKQAYTAWTAAGWNGVAAPAEFGGQDLPHAVNAACIEMLNSGSMAFGIGPALTMAAIDALAAYGADDLKQTYLPKLISGAWMGTMQLTEPQAGSDVGALRTRATRAPDGNYRITGSKIFITYGVHDLTSNIIHFVLARLPDAPPGTKGVSLFLVPKVMLNEDGTLGKHNDVRAHSVEHKLGIHGSPTCTMIYGDQGCAIGFLIGEEHKGMLCMFTMMNRTRLALARITQRLLRRQLRD